MSIELNTPVVIPAQPEATYSEVWLSCLTIHAENPNRPVGISAKIDKARTLESGRKEILANGGKTIYLPDFFSVATNDELTLMVNVITAIKTRAGV